MERVKLIISALQAKRERVKLIISMFSLDGFNFVWLDSQSAKRSRAIKNYSKKDNLQNVKLPLLD
jgi:nucleoside diphosphate kinase